ncbi:flagellar protein FlgN [Pelosinus sp. sgz500959]|uniref:flagellar protein FlgN n=1 Tax=Pelosinus sp. sgz500959 TaxID=3242472 RepID=UPI0036716E13
MNEKWEGLLAVLSQMLSIYQAILTLSQQKNRILVAAKPQELETVTKSEEVLILQVGKLEEIREKLVKELMVLYGMRDGRASLDELTNVAQPAIIEKLEIFKKEFSKVMAEIGSLNKLNTELIKQALGFINYNINLLSQTAVGPTYAAKGQNNEQAPKRTAFDARV